MNDQFDQLEMQLRALGRRMEQPAPPQAVDRARSSAMTALQCRRGSDQRHNLFVSVVFVLFATLPIPLLFLWADWATVNGLLQRVFPGETSGYVAYGYLWIKVCSLSVIYGLGVPALIYAAVRVSQSREGQLHPLQEVSA